MSIPDETNTQHSTEIITDRDMSIPDETNLQDSTNTVTSGAMSHANQTNTKIITKPDANTNTTDHTNTNTDTKTDIKTTPDSIELSPTTIAEIDRTFSSAAYHMGDFITEYRQLRDKLYSTIQPAPSAPRSSSPNPSVSPSSESSSSSSEPSSPHPHPPPPSSPTHAAQNAVTNPTQPPSPPQTRLINPLTKTDLNTLLLLLCLTTKSLLKREGYLEAKVEELTLELDGQMRIKDDWIVVHRTAIPECLGAGEEWKGGRGKGRGKGKGWFGR